MKIMLALFLLVAIAAASHSPVSSFNEIKSPLVPYQPITGPPTVEEAVVAEIKQQLVSLKPKLSLIKEDIPKALEGFKSDINKAEVDMSVVYDTNNNWTYSFEATKKVTVEKGFADIVKGIEQWVNNTLFFMIKSQERFSNQTDLLKHNASYELILRNKVNRAVDETRRHFEKLWIPVIDNLVELDREIGNEFNSAMSDYKASVLAGNDDRATYYKSAQLLVNGLRKGEKIFEKIVEEIEEPLRNESAKNFYDDIERTIKVLP